MESSAFWGRLPQLVSFFRCTAAIVFGILGALSIHRLVWKITVFLGTLGAGFVCCSAFWGQMFGILGAIYLYVLYLIPVVDSEHCGFP